MYQAGRRIVSHHKRHVVLGWFAALVILLAIGGVIFARYFLKSDTTISPPPPPKVTKVTDGSDNDKTFDSGVYTIKLPPDWKLTSHQTKVLNQFNIYTYKNTKNNPGVQQLQIYYDTIPSNLGVNHVLPVQANGNQIVPIASVSENCTSFTDSKERLSIAYPAKYQGVSFLCDLGNHERDVVGTSSPDGVNVVKISGPNTGAHRIFFAYTDNSATPEYTIFTDAVQSFRLK